MSVFDRVIEPLGRRFFWVKATGNIIAQRGEMSEGIESTKEEDFAVYVELQGLDPDSIEMTTFTPNQYAEDFASATSWRFDPEAKTIIFLRSSPEAPPVYEKPLAEQVSELKIEVADLWYEVMTGGI